MGADQREFGVHKGLLCFHSKFFKAAFHGSFKESSTGRVSLPDDDSPIFELVKTWLYTLSMTERRDWEDMKCNRERTYGAWIFGEKHGMIDMCNKIMDTLLDPPGNVVALPTVQQIEYIYTNTCKGSLLRKYIAASFFSSRHWLYNILKQDAENIMTVPEFLVDVLQLVADVQMYTPDTSRPSSLYTDRKSYFLPLER